MPDAKPITPSTEDSDILRKVQAWFGLWVNATASARQKFKRDFEVVEGNGKQWDPKDRMKVEASGRPALEFNKVLPQVKLVTGIQRRSQVGFVSLPRGLEDRRLAEIANASLKAANDFARVDRVSGRVFDDATICGLGAWKVLHSFDDTEDIIWGDINVSRVNPLCFIWDPWHTEPDMQDGAFMGDALWLDIDVFKDAYPEYANLAKPGEWMGKMKQYFGDSSQFGTGENLIPELFDTEAGRIRLMNLWYKKPSRISLLVNEKTGQVRELASAKEGEQMIADMRLRVGREAVAPFQVIRADGYSEVRDPNGALMPDPQTNEPMTYANPELAQARINQIADQMGLIATDGVKVINRKGRVPHYAAFVWWQVVAESRTPFNDLYYPYVPFISQKYGDDPESIMGMVRPLIDPIQEYNKRWSNILAHLNSSSHSGWLNRKSGGASTKELETVGSKPGVVVEYTTMAPTQIRPVELSSGHFQLLQTSSANILEISGVNADMVGVRQPAPSVVSGRAIRARQQGGNMILQPHFQAYEESLLDLNQMILRRIQQYYPPEKLRRIIGVFEMNAPLGMNGMPLFSDPMTGAPMSEDQIYAALRTLRITQFDLALKLAQDAPTERQAQFEQAQQVMSLIVSTGRPIMPNTLAAVVDLADLPTRLLEGLKRDAMAPPNPALAAPQAEALAANKSETSAGRAGGSEGPG